MDHAGTLLGVLNNGKFRVVKQGRMRYEVVISHTVPERDTGKPIEVEQGAVIFLPANATSIIERVRDVVIALMAHEVNENLHVGGVRLFDPHLSF